MNQTIRSEQPPEISGRASGVLGLRTLPVGEPRPAVWWVGVHGGAGESTLESLFGGSRAAGHHWPTARGERPVVVLVARTHAQGLRALQTAMRDCSERRLEVQLLGLVFVADARGRLPRGLRELMAIVSGGAPEVWCVPFVEAWRVGEIPTRRNAPREVNELYEQLRGLLEQQQEDQ